MRRDRRNAECQWPGEPAGSVAVSARHLSADAEFAEDLAIRYADTHHGLRTKGWVSGEVYLRERNQCIGLLFGQVAAQHGVRGGEVLAALGKNRGLVDLGVNLPFGMLYAFAAWWLARGVWRRYPPDEAGWMPGIVMAAFLALVAPAAGTLMGEQWSVLAESYRIGNDHMSYRVDRLLWNQHRGVLFAAGVAVFAVAAAAVGIRRGGVRPPSQAGPR